MADRPRTPAELVWSYAPVPPMSEQRLALFGSGDCYTSVETCWWGTDEDGLTGWLSTDMGTGEACLAQAGDTGWWWAWLGTIDMDDGEAA